MFHSSTKQKNSGSCTITRQNRLEEGYERQKTYLIQGQILDVTVKHLCI